MTTDPPALRCSAVSLASTEPLEGTASTVRTFLLLESPGPWGVHATHSERLDGAVRSWLGLVEGHGMRPLLIRRPGRSPATGTRLFVAHVSGPAPVIASAVLDSPLDVLGVDPGSLAAGGTAGLGPHQGRLFLTCTHGKHDACCAELGRPLAAALAAAAPEETWEVSHIGGDRFAPNVLVLPHGLYYGRLLPSEAGDLVAAHHQGLLDLEHLRGRSSYPFAVQAAEIHLRRHLGHLDAAAPHLVEHLRDGDLTTVVLGVAGGRWRVQVQARRSDPSRLTCRSTSPSAPLRHALRAIEQLHA